MLTHTEHTLRPILAIAMSCAITTTLSEKVGRGIVPQQPETNNPWEKLLVETEKELRLYDKSSWAWTTYSAALIACNRINDANTALEKAKLLTQITDPEYKHDVILYLECVIDKYSIPPRDHTNKSTKLSKAAFAFFSKYVNNTDVSVPQVPPSRLIQEIIRDKSQIINFLNIGHGVILKRPPTPPISSDMKNYIKQTGKPIVIKLEIVIGADGIPQKVNPLPAEQPFATNCINYALAWRFQPINIFGENVSSKFYLTMPFQVK